ncbi:MAG TPA: RNA polymerase factor sigma-32 [Myxococcota bacterium]|nr:RNA polymerase factor sigma-32 [Myxococcota bacterium]
MEKKQGTKSGAVDKKNGKSSKGLVQHDPLKLYLQEIGQFDLLTPDEEHELAVKFVKTQDPKLAYRLITANLRLVVKIALEHRNYYQNLLDLIQEGNIGLMQAVKKFDPYRGVRLPSYAQWWIRAYVLKFILENFSLVKIGTTQAQRKLFYRLRKEQRKLLMEGYTPTAKLLAERIDVSEKDVIEMEKRLSGPEASLDATHPTTGRPFIETLVVPHESPEQQVATEELRDRVHGAMLEFRQTLDERERAIWDARIMPEHPETFQDLGEKHGITRQRVQQVERRLQQRFKDFLMAGMSDADGRPRF